MLELNFLTWHRYDGDGSVFCYCIETHSQGSADNFNISAAEKMCVDNVLWELSERENCENLKCRGWLIGTTIVPPVVNLEEAITTQTKKLAVIGYPENFNNFNHLKKVIEIPPIVKR